MSNLKDRLKLTIKSRLAETSLMLKQEEFSTAKLSRVIEIALSDMKLSIKRGVSIDMGGWVEKNRVSGDCFACFAGCVMLETFSVEKDLTQEYGPNFCLKEGMKFIGESMLRFHSLDQIRQGNIGQALREMYNHEQVSEYKGWFRSVPKFDENNPEIFFNDMHSIASLLREKGL